MDLLQGARVQDVTLAPTGHSVTFTQLGEEVTVKARWVVDAAGRASFLKRKLGMGTNVGHVVNSAWVRLGGGFDLEDWGRHDAGFMARMSEPGQRMFSTNHLFGDGYWMWLIPLSSGPISIGVCTDASIHPFEEISTFDAFLDWLRRHEPQLADVVEARTDDIEDFLRVEDFAYGVERVFSPDRWSLVGEAGAFADPLYSPGSDFIGFGNVFTTDLITRDLDGEDIDALVERHNDFYLRTWAGAMSRTENLYPAFGNAWVTAAKIVWDGQLNHSGIVMLMVKDKLTDTEFMDSVEEDLFRLHRLNLNMQRLFREWNEIEQRPLTGPPAGVNQLLRDAIARLNAEVDDEGIRDALRTQVSIAEAMAVALFYRAAQALDEPPPEDKPLNPYAVGLKPERWEGEGLFEGPGLTSREALEQIGGLEWLFGAPAGAAT